MSYHVDVGDKLRKAYRSQPKLHAGNSARTQGVAGEMSPKVKVTKPKVDEKKSKQQKR